MPRTPVVERLCTLRLRRPRSVHGPLESERVEERDGVLAAVVSEVAVVVVDHRDARAHEARDGEDRDAGAEREGGVRVAQVVEIPQRLDAGRPLSGRASSGDGRSCGNQSGHRAYSETGSRSLGAAGGRVPRGAFDCRGTARLLSRVFVRLSLPLAYARRT